MAYVSGNGTLVRALLADALVDEVHLLIYPVALGTGPWLFPEHGVVHLTYTPATS